ncbi:MAG: UbiA family prenyltransferase [Chloroflexales bacterium]|nr:UbiA family prenyltransferase [Chloroflexales bacterium]
MAKHIVHKLPTKRGALIQHMRAHLELADPVTWIAPMLVVLCGAIAAGHGDPGFQLTDGGDLLLVGAAAIMCGPLGTGFSQSINDYFDRELDAINDPSRPIPSRRVTLGAARLNWIGLGLATMAVALLLARQSVWVPVLAAVSLALAAAYSVPPFKLKQRYWLGPPAVGFGYIFLTWVGGHLIFAPLTWPSLVIALAGSALAAGLLFLNDIKSVEGDRRHGLRSMTVALGVRRTLIVSFLVIGIFELVIALMALLAGQLWATAVVALALAAPIPSQVQLYREPTHKNFLRFMIVNNPFAMLLLIMAAFIVGGYFG